MTISQPLGEALLEQGLLDRALLNRTLALQRQAGLRLGSNLLELGAITEVALLQALGKLHQRPTATGQELAAAGPAIRRLITKSAAVTYSAMPYAVRGNTLWIASTDPLSVREETDLGRPSSLLVRSAIAIEARILQALESSYQLPSSTRARNIVATLDGHRKVATRTRSTEELLLQPSSPEDDDPSWIGIVVEPQSPPADEAGSEESEPQSTPESHDPPQPVAQTPANHHFGDRYFGDDSDRPSQRPSQGDDRVDEYQAQHQVIAADQPSPGGATDLGPRAAAESDRNQTAQRLLDSYSGRYAKRALFLIEPEGRIRGWTGDGSGIMPRRLLGIDLPLAESPILSRMTRDAGRPPSTRPIPDNEADPIVRQLAEAVNASDEEIRLLPLAIRRQVAGFLLLASPRPEAGSLGSSPAPTPRENRAALETLARLLLSELD